MYLKHSVEIAKPVEKAPARLAEIHAIGLSPGHGGEAAKERGAKLAEKQLAACIGSNAGKDARMEGNADARPSRRRAERLGMNGWTPESLGTVAVALAALGTLLLTWKVFTVASEDLRHDASPVLVAKVAEVREDIPNKTRAVVVTTIGRDESIVPRNLRTTEPQWPAVSLTLQNVGRSPAVSLVVDVEVEIGPRRLASSIPFAAIAPHDSVTVVVQNRLKEHVTLRLLQRGSSERWYAKRGRIPVAVISDSAIDLPASEESEQEYDDRARREQLIRKGEKLAHPPPPSESLISSENWSEIKKGLRERETQDQRYIDAALEEEARERAERNPQPRNDPTQE